MITQHFFLTEMIFQKIFMIILMKYYFVNSVTIIVYTIWKLTTKYNIGNDISPIE